MRAAAGITIIGVYQSVADENSVTVISEILHPDTAKVVLQSPEMKGAMDKSGVINAPEVMLLNRAF